MRYSICGEELAKLIIAAGARMDADEIGEIVHRVKPISEPVDVTTPSGAEIDTGWPDPYVFNTAPPAKPE